MVAVAVADPTFAQERPSKEIPQLLVLDRFVGSWDVEISVKPGQLVRGGAKARGTTVNAWSTNGTVLHQAWSIVSSDGKPLFTGKTELTYDPQRKVYRNSTTLTQGAPSTSDGVWDERSGALVWTGRDPKTKSTTVSRSTATRDGVETWTMVISDANGRAVFECSGTNTRRRR